MFASHVQFATLSFQFRFTGLLSKRLVGDLFLKYHPIQLNLQMLPSALFCLALRSPLVNFLCQILQLLAFIRATHTYMWTKLSKGWVKLARWPALSLRTLAHFLFLPQVLQFAQDTLILLFSHERPALKRKFFLWQTTVDSPK